MPAVGFPGRVVRLLRGVGGEDLEHELSEAQVEQRHQCHDHDHEDHHHDEVGDELGLGRPDHLAQFGDDLTEEGQDARALLLVAGIAHCVARSEEHTSELQSLMRISYAVFCLKKNINYDEITKAHTPKTTYTQA